MWLGLPSQYRPAIHFITLIYNSMWWSFQPQFQTEIQLLIQFNPTSHFWVPITTRVPVSDPRSNFWSQSKCNWIQISGATSMWGYNSHINFVSCLEILLTGPVNLRILFLVQISSPRARQQLTGRVQTEATQRLSAHLLFFHNHFILFNREYIAT
jgi:hypothetical protein